MYSHFHLYKVNLQVKLLTFRMLCILLLRFAYSLMLIDN